MSRGVSLNPRVSLFVAAQLGKEFLQILETRFLFLAYALSSAPYIEMNRLTIGLLVVLAALLISVLAVEAVHGSKSSGVLNSLSHGLNHDSAASTTSEAVSTAGKGISTASKALQMHTEASSVDSKRHENTVARSDLYVLFTTF